MARTVHRQRKHPLLKEPPAGRPHVFLQSSEISAALIAPDAEWLESDGLGGFASGPVLGARTRRYQALLLTATTPPTGRIVQVNAVEPCVEVDGSVVPLGTNRYLPDVLHPQGWKNLIEFASFPWPTWTFRITDQLTVRQEILVARDTCETVLRWSTSDSPSDCRLTLRLLMSGRDYHALHRENSTFDFRSKVQGGNVVWRPYAGLPAVTALTNGSYREDPQWFRNFLYVDERERGLDHVEDLASPGVFTWNLNADPAIMVLRSGDSLNVRTEAYAARLSRRRVDAPRGCGKPIGSRGRQLSCRSSAMAARCSPDFRGSPIGVATRSLPCADW